MASHNSLTAPLASFTGSYRPNSPEPQAALDGGSFGMDSQAEHAGWVVPSGLQKSYLLDIVREREKFRKNRPDKELEEFRAEVENKGGEELVRELSDYESDDVQIREFDVAGPAVLLAQRAIFFWMFNLGFPVVAYRFTPVPPEKNTLTHYPWSLWLGFLAFIIPYTKVQVEILQYILPVRASVLRPFKVACQCYPFKSVYEWYYFAIVKGTFETADVGINSLFLVTFLRSVSPDMQQAWEMTAPYSLFGMVPLSSDLAMFATTIYLLQWFQFFFMVLNWLPAEEAGVDYTHFSMEKGYRVMWSTFASRWAPQNSEREEEEVELRLHHADVFETLISYGRMGVLTDQSFLFAVNRIENEEKKIKEREGTFSSQAEEERHQLRGWARYSHMAAMKLRHFSCRFILINILEMVFKLELQIMVFTLLKAVNPKVVQVQLVLAILFSFIGVFISICMGFITLIWFVPMWRKLKRCSVRKSVTNASFRGRDGLKMKRAYDAIERNYYYVTWWLLVWLVLTIFTIHTIIHAAMRFGKALHCDGTVVTFDFQKLWPNCLEERTW